MDRLLILAIIIIIFQQAQGNLGEEEKLSAFNEKDSNSCDFFKGSWIEIEDSSYDPLYNETSCPFIGFNCLNNGRPDKDYLKFKWKPNLCELPRFDGRDFLERFKGKKIMFVGDSLSNNMWQSLTCMLYTAIPNSNYTLTNSGLLYKFFLPEYGISIMFIKNGFLVDLVNEKIGKVVRLDSISSGSQWKGVDMLIFNTFHWWTHTGKTKTWDYFQVGNVTVQEMDRMEALKIVLKTLANWIDSNIDPLKTSVFYQGVSAVHTDGNDWSDPRARNCRGQTKPIEGSKYPGPDNAGEEIVKSVLSSLGNKAYLLDITLLSQLRKDGHPSVYNGQGGRFVDCSHWCLPGVPDTWNEILYAIFVNR